MERSGKTPHDCPTLLTLPIEIRRLIYAQLLPHMTSIPVRQQRYHASTTTAAPPSSYHLTYVRSIPGSSEGTWHMVSAPPKSDRETGHDIVWRRGCTSLLAVNRQVHEETASMLYGDNTFVVDIAFDSINFRYRWRTSNGLMPSRTYAFLEHFSQRNLLRVRRYVVNVEHVDDYTSMIKYNCGGRGLTAGLKGKVAELVRLLGDAKEIYKLQIHLIDGAISRQMFPGGRVHRVQDESNYEQAQAVLEPFKRLRGVRRVDVSGVNSQYAKTLEETMSSRVE
ncbi:hypothetical protein IAQ61_012049 [Plenodomus lingam]|uniref:DUF7730 domain-containing protein n=1 Tax=Leptosphaeria maculans (strain JN3 / isolate v23.1.3 / race Av1-4-5-6-7-8) TaxID=985895 RepID=E5ABY3_LEPMJ|nr:hypothetical protein LEMA_P023040.1 [Plenodomus lingam JN3]KAH9860264.1 hypothetical protein IAQ61_012049 [Plenodomus lingam]CBY01174.1 hypothetical protein LEMA_P023040.1 [Plenodomus lingam JN3]